MCRTPKREMTASSMSMRMDRTIIEGLHDIVSVLEDHLKPLVQVMMPMVFLLIFGLYFGSGPSKSV